MPAAVIFAKTNASGSWQPDSRLRLTVAGLATLAAISFFVHLLNQPAVITPFREALVFSVHPTPTPYPKEVKPHRLAPAPNSGLRPVIPASVPPPSLSPLPHDWYGEAQAAVAAQGGSIRPPSLGDTQALQQALQTTPPPETLPDGQAYHNAYGSTVLKSGNACGEARTVATGPAPQDKTVVTAPIACPGEHKPTMGDQLLGWAKTLQQKLPQPPR